MSSDDRYPEWALEPTRLVGRFATLRLHWTEALTSFSQSLLHLTLMHKLIKTKTVLGSGTYGEVTKAYIRNPDGTAGRAVAVKKLFLQKQATEGLDVTALRDIKFLRELSHPNVIEVRQDMHPGALTGRISAPLQAVGLPGPFFALHSR